MKHLYRVQTGASVLVFGSLASAEVAARLLEVAPSSALLWRLNLEVFRSVGRLRTTLYPVYDLISAYAIPLCLVVMLVALVAHVGKHRLAIAMTAHLSCGFVVGLIYLGLIETQAPQTASLAAIAVVFDRDGLLLGALLTATSVATVASHYGFVRAILVETADIADEEVAPPASS